MSDRLQPALLGGVLIGVLAALPVVNCCCCIWMIAGGALAAYLRQQSLPYQLAAAEGALIGLMAGVVGAVISSVLSIPIQMATGPVMQAWMERLVAGNPDMPPELRDAFGRANMMGPGRWVLGFVVALLVYPIFALLGGLLGAVLFKKNLPPQTPGTIDVPSSPTL
jgi:hypothetical protein